MVQEHWAHADTQPEPPTKGTTYDMPAYDNGQMFRLGQGGAVSGYIASSQSLMFSVMPSWFTIRFQGVAEHLFRLLHTSESLGFMRAILGWQHSPDGRGEVHKQPKGYLYTWAGWLDEIVNLFMGLQHVEVCRPSACLCLCVPDALCCRLFSRCTRSTALCSVWRLSSSTSISHGGD